jgi:hypothetical protein
MNSIQNTELPQLSITQSADASTINSVTRPGRLHYSMMLAHTLFISPIATSACLAGRAMKLLTWDLGKAGTLKALGYHAEANFFEREYLKTVGAARDLAMVPVEAYSAFSDAIAQEETYVDDFKPEYPQSYLSVEHTKKFTTYTSALHGCKTFNVIMPNGIVEFAAESDGALNTVMASHFLKPNVFAINFGVPNVSTFITEAKEDGSVQTMKVDAKSLKREKMTYHATNGKIQSGVFFIPAYLPEEALERFKAAAQKLEGRADITCVNTNCRVLKEAGFSIENLDMEQIVLPPTFLEHLLFRNVFYTDLGGTKHKVHFDIVCTTKHSLEKCYEEIDLAVLGTRLRHQRRNADTEENRKTRGEAARALIAEEKKRLEHASRLEQDVPDLKKRKLSVSVPSYLGDGIASIWGRHTIYELDLSDKKAKLAKAFEKLPKLQPFPQENPSFVTRLKRDMFFSQPTINLLRRHMMGDMDTIYLNTRDLFSHLKSTKGEHLNYVVMDDKLVLARVNANGNAEEAHRKAADWALSKHALLSGRAEVYCSGELWYDKEQESFVIDNNSGTYMPSQEHVNVAAALANRIFKTDAFKVAEPKA